MTHETAMLELSVRRRISTNRRLAELEKTAVWGLVGRAATGVGRWAMHNPGKAGFGVLNAYGGISDAKELANEYKNQANVGGNRFVTADGHRRSTAATTWRTIGSIADWAWLIPGVGWAVSLVGGLGARAIANGIQNRADKQWAQAQAGLQNAGIDSNNPFGRYGNKPMARR
jgi:hypothetical protein